MHAMSTRTVDPAVSFGQPLRRLGVGRISFIYLSCYLGEEVKESRLESRGPPPAPQNPGML